MALSACHFNVCIVLELWCRVPGWEDPYFMAVLERHPISSWQWRGLQLSVKRGYKHTRRWRSKLQIKLHIELHILETRVNPVGLSFVDFVSHLASMDRRPFCGGRPASEDGAIDCHIPWTFPFHEQMTRRVLRWYHMSGLENVGTQNHKAYELRESFVKNYLFTTAGS